MKHLIEVPYYSQHLDIEDDYWKPRACGIACLKMVMDTYNRYTPPLYALVRGGESRGGFGFSGWIHDTIVNIAKDHHFSAERREYDSFSAGISDILEFLDQGAPVIASAVKNFSEPGKFHLVVLVGFEKEGERLRGFYYHDSDSLNNKEGMYKFVPTDIFEKFWRKKAIFIFP